MPHLPTSLEGEKKDPVQLALPGPLFIEGLADSALEDGEFLKNPAISPWSPK